MICGSWIAELRRREARTKTMPRWLAYTRNKVIHSSLQLNFSDSYMAARQRRSRRNSRSFPVISPISGLTCVRMYVCMCVFAGIYDRSRISMRVKTRFRVSLCVCTYAPPVLLIWRIAAQLSYLEETCQGLSAIQEYIFYSEMHSLISLPFVRLNINLHLLKFASFHNWRSIPPMWLKVKYHRHIVMRSGRGEGGIYPRCVCKEAAEERYIIITIHDNGNSTRNSARARARIMSAIIATESLHNSRYNKSRAGENASIKYRRPRASIYRRRIAICQITRAAITREFNYALSMFCCVDKPRGR